MQRLSVAFYALQARQLRAASKHLPVLRAVTVRELEAAVARSQAGFEACAHRAFHAQTTALQQAVQAAQSMPTIPGLASAEDLKLDDLIVTVKAAKRINAIKAKHVSEGKASPDAPFALRVKVEGGGCSGFRYEFIFEQSPPAADDIIFSRDGATVLVDSVSLDLVRGSTLEWDDTMMRSAFAVSGNPNAESSCGCKSSFAPKAKE